MSDILVIGANGGIGRQCVGLALQYGHQVTAILRTPSKLPLTHPNLRIVKGDILEPASITSHFAEKDLIISALGVPGGLGGDRPTTLYSDGASNILASMAGMGTRRVFFISASAVETNPLLPFYVRFVSKYIIQKLLKHMYADLLKMEGLIKQSNLDWTIVRPPQLTDKPATGKYRMAIDQFLKNGLKISRADTAHFMLNNIENKILFQKTVEIGY